MSNDIKERVGSYNAAYKRLGDAVSGNGGCVDNLIRSHERMLTGGKGRRFVNFSGIFVAPWDDIGTNRIKFSERFQGVELNRKSFIQHIIANKVDYEALCDAIDCCECPNIKELFNALVRQRNGILLDTDKLAFWVANKFGRAIRLPYDDKVQQCRLGLIYALDKYDGKIAFSTFTTLNMRAFLWRLLKETNRCFSTSVGTQQKFFTYDKYLNLDYSHQAAAKEAGLSKKQAEYMRSHYVAFKENMKLPRVETDEITLDEMSVSRAEIDTDGIDVAALLNKLDTDKREVIEFLFLAGGSKVECAKRFNLSQRGIEDLKTLAFATMSA